MTARTEKPRRPRGTGSLAARRDTAGRETWYARFYVNRRLVKRRVGPKRVEGTREGLTRAQAEKALRRMIEEGRPRYRQSSASGSRRRGERYLRHLEQKGRKASTLEDYRSFLRIHLTPFFDGKSLDAISPTDVEEFVAAERRAGRSAKSILNLSLLHSIFAYGQHPRRDGARVTPRRWLRTSRRSSRARTFASSTRRRSRRLSQAPTGTTSGPPSESSTSPPP
jgi:hypothetical protein